VGKGASGAVPTILLEMVGTLSLCPPYNAMRDQAVGWAKAHRAVPTLCLECFDWWARSALPTLHLTRTPR